MEKIKVISLLACLISCQLLFAQRMGAEMDDVTTEDSWYLEKDEEGVSVYTRSISEEYLKEYKAVTTVSANIEDLLSFICEISKASEWGYNIKQSRIIDRVNKDEFYVHLLADAPWPVTDRDMVYKFRITRPNASTYKCIMINAPEKIPSTKDHIRIPKMEGFWQLEDLGNNQIRVTHQVLSHPGGSLPLWLANMVVVAGPFTTLSNLRKLFPST